MNFTIGRGVLAAGALAILWACGGEGGSTATGSTTEATVREQADLAVDDPTDDTCRELTVKNFESWCKVSINGRPYSAAPSQKVCVTPGTIHLKAEVASKAFELGPDPWYDTTTPGVTKGAVSSATVDVKKATCVWACCPFTDGSGCPTTDQCP